ncbi:MAG: GNAT family N-acetyltransferase [Chloroflexi bacterium]|nr:GNAT family N-acetyltransferase [Chloroflexota bacterium]
MTGSLQIEFIRSSQVSPEFQKIIDRLDHLAFAGDVAEEDPNEWADSDWMVLGRVDGEIVTQLGLLKRKIRVGTVLLPVGGVGGVATHPAWQRRGLSTALLRAAAPFIQTELKVFFGLLNCANESQPFYARLGWKTVSTELWFTENKKRRSLQTPVMILPLSNRDWPEGEIDLCGLPW